MAWQAPWRKKHHVDADIVAWSREARAQHFGGCSDAAQAILVDGKVEIGGAIAPFDFDKGDGPPTSRNKVDFADGHAEPLAQNAPAVKAQPPCGAALGLAPTCFGGGAVQACSFSVSARA